MLLPLRARGRVQILLTLCLSVGCVVAAGHAQKPARHTQTVTISGFDFHPGSLTVSVGDTVVWTNKDIVTHTVTDATGHFDSGSIKPGASWRLLTKKSGTFHYACSPHPNMQGTLIVQ